jgi:hypothetical protein
VTSPRAASPGNWVRACSACPGDYEDPEVTAWSEAGEGEDAEGAEVEEAEPSAARERFPVREE